MYWNKPYKTSAYTKIGRFKVKNIDKYKNIYTYTCYDYVNKFDTIVDTWYNGLTYPINLATMFSTLCTAVGVTGDSNFDGYPAVVDAKKFNATNLNGKTILQWISQIAGGYCYADPDGVVRIRHYATSGSVASLTNSDYVKLNIANYTVPAPNWIRIVTDPSGAYTDRKEGNNLIKISGNPLCYNCNSTVTYAKNILGWMVSYVPYTIQLLDDKGIKAGDRITINGIQTLVMEKKIQPSGVVLTTNGQEVRQENTELYQESIDLSNYYTKAEVYNKGEVYNKNEVWSKDDWYTGQVNIITTTPATNAMTMQYTQNGQLYKGYFRGSNIQLSHTGTGINNSTVLTGANGGALSLSDGSVTASPYANLRIFKDTARNQYGMYGYNA